MKILFIVNNFNIGGPQKSLLSLLHYFPSNYKIDLMVLNGDDQLKKYLPDNVVIKHAPNPVKLLMLSNYKLVINILIGIIKTPVLTIKAVACILKTKLLKRKFTQVKQQFWHLNKNQVKVLNPINYDIAIAVSGGHSVMYLVDYIESDIKVGWVRTEYQNLQRDLELDNIYFEEMDKILSVSDQCSNKFTECFPNQSSKIKTFYNALPFNMYKKISNTENMDNNYDCFTITTISRLVQGKGFELLLEAAEILRNRGIKFRWNIYGTGPLKKEIQDEINSNDLQDYVFIMGFEFNTGKVLINTDILVHPSRFEGKSNTIDEAKYYEIPIVCTNYPTVSEQLTNRYDSLIVDFSGEAIVEAIYELIDNKELQNELKMNLKTYSEEVNNREPFKEFIDLVKEK